MFTPHRSKTAGHADGIDLHILIGICAGPRCPNGPCKRRRNGQGIWPGLGAQSCSAMYSMTASASRLVAYRLHCVPDWACALSAMQALAAANHTIHSSGPTPKA
jgi:hypothetical protein